MKITNAAIYDIIEATKKFSNAKGKTAFVLFRVLRKLQYISDWSSDVCSSDLQRL